MNNAEYKTFVKAYFADIGMKLPEDTYYQYSDYFEKYNRYLVEIATMGANIMNRKKVSTGIITKPRPKYVFIGECEKGFLMYYFSFDKFLKYGAYEETEIDGVYYARFGRGNMVNNNIFMTFFKTKENKDE